MQINDFREYKKRKLPNYLHFFSIMFLLVLSLYGLKDQMIHYCHGAYLYIMGGFLFLSFFYFSSIILNDSKKIILSDEGIYIFNKTVDYKLRKSRYELLIEWKQVTDVRFDVHQSAIFSPEDASIIADASLLVDYLDGSGDNNSIVLDDSFGNLQEMKKTFEEFLTR